ncbi:MAG: haloacid dehalogenase, partial [Polaromonas sp.]
MEKPRSAPPTPLRAVLFDAYGTLFDVYSVGQLAEQLFPGQGQALGVLWRDKQIEYTHLVTSSNGGAHYQPFWKLTRAALVYA